MTEPGSPLPEDQRRALGRVGARWDQARTERTLPEAHRKIESARRARAIGAGALVVACAAAAALALMPSAAPEPVQEAARQEAQRVSFEDGSIAHLLDESSRVIVSAVSSTRIDVSLPAGRARFEISERRERSFRVTCGEVVVQVLGTVFELERRDDRTFVSVTRGRVAVRWPGGAIELGAGESGTYPPSALGGAHAPPEPLAAGDEQAPIADGAERAREPGHTAKRSPSESWQKRAERGDYRGAYTLLSQLARQGTRVADDVEDLLLAADAARLSGHPAEAVPYLRKVTDAHASDPRAPLAAFTLGGVLMSQLAKPREAQAAYARARALSPNSALSQDALARQVEAAHRAGDAGLARKLGEEYLRSYPDGRRVHAVRRFAGLL